MIPRNGSVPYSTSERPKAVKFCLARLQVASVLLLTIMTICGRSNRWRTQSIVGLAKLPVSPHKSTVLSPLCDATHQSFGKLKVSHYGVAPWVSKVVPYPNKAQWYHSGHDAKEPQCCSTWAGSNQWNLIDWGSKRSKCHLTGAPRLPQHGRYHQNSSQDTKLRNWSRTRDTSHKHDTNAHHINTLRHEATPGIVPCQSPSCMNFFWHREGCRKKKHPMEVPLSTELWLQLWKTALSPQHPGQGLNADPQSQEANRWKKIWPSKMASPIYLPELDRDEKLPLDLQPPATKATVQSLEPTPKKPHMRYSSLSQQARTETFRSNLTNEQSRTSATQQPLLNRIISHLWLLLWTQYLEPDPSTQLMEQQGRRLQDLRPYQGYAVKKAGTPHIQKGILGAQWTECSSDSAPHLSFGVKSGNIASLKDNPSSPRACHGPSRPWGGRPPQPPRCPQPSSPWKESKDP